MSIGSRTRTFALSALTAATLAVAGSPAQAADQVWGFKGTLTSYVAALGYVELPDVPLGSTVRGQVLFDDAETDLDGSTTSGSYPFTTLTLALDGTTDLHVGISAVGNIGIKDNDPIGGGDLRDEIGMTIGDFFLVPSLTTTVIDLQFRLNTDSVAPPTVLASDALPSTLPALSSFTNEQLLSVIGYVDFDVTNFDVSISEFGPVGFPDLPLIPDSVTVETDGSVTWTFTTLGLTICVTGCWVDPPAASGFVYEMTNSALFTGVVDFPAGFGTALEVSVGASSLGTFGPGDSVDFSGFPGGGVAQFVLSGIEPSTGVESAEAFPLNISFDSGPATFTMTSIPESPSLPGLGGAAIVALCAVLTAGGAAALRRYTR